LGVSWEQYETIKDVLVAWRRRSKKSQLIGILEDDSGGYMLEYLKGEMPLDLRGQGQILSRF